MSCERLSKMLDTGILDLNPTEESLIIKAKNKLLRKKAKDAKKPKEAEDEEMALDEGHEDGDGNIAWRAVKNTENEMFIEDDFNTDIDYNELLERREKAKEFIEIADKVKKLKDGEMKKLKDMAKSNHRRCGHKPRLVGRLDEFQ